MAKKKVINIPVAISLTLLPRNLNGVYEKAFLDY